MARCQHCGGNIIGDGAYHEGQYETYLRCLQCGREAKEMDRPKKKCDICGKEFQPTGNCQKRCADCNQKARNEYSRQWRNKQREIVKEVGQKPKPKPVVPEVRPAVGAFLDMLRPELLNAILEDARKQVAKDIVAHLQATFLEG